MCSWVYSIYTYSVDVSSTDAQPRVVVPGVRALIYTVVAERHTVVTVGTSLQVHTCITVNDGRIHVVP